MTSLAALESLCAEYVARLASDAAHDQQHVRRVVGNARHLAELEGADLDVVVPAAWLHDCVTVPKHSDARSRASRMAAERATMLLVAFGYQPELVPRVAHAIEAHSFTAGIPPRTIEAKVVQDADRLDALGAVGIARCLRLSGASGAPLYADDDPFCLSRAADDRVSAVDHFYTKLLGLSATMQTAGGRREAEARTAFMQAYLAQLAREIDAAAAGR